MYERISSRNFTVNDGIMDLQTNAEVKKITLTHFLDNNKGNNKKLEKIEKEVLKSNRTNSDAYDPELDERAIEISTKNVTANITQRKTFLNKTDKSNQKCKILLILSDSK